MKNKISVLAAILIAGLANWLFANGLPSADPMAEAKARSAFSGLPLCFESNTGQTDSSVKFLARGKGYTLFLTSKEAVLVLKANEREGDVVRMSLKGASADPVVSGTDVLAGRSNYLTGDSPKDWNTDIKRYSKVEYKQVYPGIDLAYYGKQGQLEYDFVVAPGADPSRIGMNFKGAKSIKLDEEGNLVLNLSNGRLAFNAPVLYQKAGEIKEPVAGRFVLAGNEEVGIEVSAYDKSRELIIDPSLLYSTYIGGTVEDRVNAIALDISGNVYLAGLTVSTGFPGSAGKYQSANAGGTDAFVSKIDATGVLLWSTYIGGAGIDIANAIAVNSSGIVYITGSTTSVNFPTVNPFQASSAGGTDVFVTAINAFGTALVYSTYFGCPGVDDGNGIAVDSLGNAYVTGDTTASGAPAFPTTVGAYQTIAGGAMDAFVAKFNSAGGVVYSTFLGGTSADIGRAIAVDGSGNAYVCGQAADAFFPTASYPTVFKPTITGAYDAFIARLGSTGASLEYVTYVGGSGIDDAYAIALDGTNPATLNVYITGYTFSADFPDGNSLFATVGVPATLSTAPDAYVFKLNMNGGAGHLAGVYSTFIGGATDDRGTSIAVDTAGDAYITGRTTSGTGFPTVNPLNGTKSGTGDVFVTEVGPTGATKVFSTYLGGTTDQQGNGVALDGSRNIYVGGWTKSADFPTAVPFQAAYAGGLYDGFVTKISAPSPAPSPAITGINPNVGPDAGGTIVTITGTGFTGVTFAAGVKFGLLNAASYTVNSDTQIIATTAAHIAAIVDVSVTRPPTFSSPIVLADQFTFFVTPAGGGSSDCDPYIFPSPTTGSTAGLAYCMTGSGVANIRVYNEVGYLVYSANERKPAGPQGSTINVAKMAPGVYFCLLNAKYDDGTTVKHAKIKFAVTH